MSDFTIALLAFAATLITSTGAFLAVRIQRSGRVNTTEAAILWVEEREMRHDLQKELAARQTIIDNLRIENAALHSRIDELEGK